MEMRIVVGVHPNTKFKIYGTSGKDITDELCVREVRIHVPHTGDSTRVEMVVYAETEVESDNVTVEAMPEVTKWS